MSSSSVIGRPSTWSRSTSISEAKPSRGGTDGRNTDAVSPRLRARTKRPTACAKNSGVDGRGRVDADRQPGYVDALGDHPDRDHPAVLAVGERRRSSSTPVFSSDRTTVGASPRDLPQQLGVGAGGVLVGRDDQAARVGHVPAYLREPLVGRRQHRRDPRPARVERGAQRLRGEVLGQRLAEPGGDLVAGAGAPLHLAGVGHEQHRPHDVVGQRVGVAVGEVGDRARARRRRRARSSRTGSGSRRSGTACRSAPAAGSRARTPRVRRRPTTARRRRGAPRRGSPAS